jgi:hypothetical protein
MPTGRIEIQSPATKTGTCTHLRVVFGPHYFMELDAGSDGKVNLILGATHHGFRADASEVGGDLEGLINEIRDAHPDQAID